MARIPAEQLDLLREVDLAGVDHLVAVDHGCDHVSIVVIGRCGEHETQAGPSGSTFKRMVSASQSSQASLRFR